MDAAATGCGTESRQAKSSCSWWMCANRMNGPQADCRAPCIFRWARCSERTGEIPADSDAGIHLRGGWPAWQPAAISRSLGRDAINLAGGVTAWTSVYGAPPQPDHEHGHSATGYRPDISGSPPR